MCNPVLHRDVDTNKDQHCVCRVTHVSNIMGLTMNVIKLKMHV